MRTISYNYFKGLKFLKRGNGTKKASSESQFLHKMAVGDAVVIGKKEWPHKVSPGNILHSRETYYKEGKKFECHELEDRTGWALLRLK